MPLKWKIFRIANYFILLISLAITGVGTYFFIGSNLNSADVFYFIIFAAGGLVLIINYSINIFLLERYYPDGELPASLLMLNTIVLLLSCLTVGFLTLVFAVEFYDVVLAPKYNRGLFSRAGMFSLLFGMILLTTYYIFWMQVALRKTIRRNRQSLYSAFLDSK
jgi:fumarate reductase subunit D